MRVEYVSRTLAEVLQLCWKCSKAFLRKDLPDFFALAFRNFGNVLLLHASCLDDALRLTCGFLIIADGHTKPVGA